MRSHTHPLSLYACMLAAGAAWGQTSQPVKDALLDTSYLRAHAETRGFMLGRPTRPTPTPDGKAVIFLRAQPRLAAMRLYEFDVATGKTRELLTPEQVLKGAAESLSPEEKARRERMRVSVGGFTDFKLSPDGSLVLVSLSGKLYVLNRPTGQVRELPTGRGTILDPQFAPDGKRVAYVRDHDLYMLDLATQQERAVTTGGSERLTHGLAEFVAQEEMARFSGYWWAPEGRHIAYEESDANGVEIWHVADPAKPDSKPHTSFYPRPGRANVKVRLGVVPVEGGETEWIRWDAGRYPYLARVNWDKHGPLTLQVQSRDQKELVLLMADPGTGQTSPLVVERDPAWVNLETDIPQWLENGNEFLWISERDGGPQLEMRDKQGKQLRVLVPANAGFQGLLDLDETADRVTYRASSNPTEAHLFQTSLQGTQHTPERKDHGQHSATFAKNHSIYAEQSTSLDAMPKVTVRRADGTLIGELPSTAEDPPWVPKTELVKVGEGQSFYAMVLRPRDFDPHKRYPVIVDVYGGPKHQVVLAAMGPYLLKQWLADQGFIVVAFDGRGTPGRGRDWERAISKHFGSVPLEDQVAALQALGKRCPEMDLQRVGIVGWSFGGYMSALAVLKRPDVYKAAVAGAPVVDWLDYDTHYTERYLGLPDKDPQAYQEGSLLTYAAGLERPLLLVHGTADDNVYFRHTLKLADALFRAGKHFELLPLSGLTHMVPEPVVMEQLWSRIARHFRKHLASE